MECRKTDEMFIFQDNGVDLQLGQDGLHRRKVRGRLQVSNIASGKKE
jgi:hypothetical protein